LLNDKDIHIFKFEGEYYAFDENFMQMAVVDMSHYGAGNDDNGDVDEYDYQ